MQVSITSTCHSLVGHIQDLNPGGAGGAGDAGKAGEDADPDKATSKLLAKAAVAAGEGILGRNAETVLTSQ